MKIENKTTFRSLPFRQIATRLSNRLGRVMPRKLRIEICCDEGRKCKHGTYLLAQLSQSSGVQYTGRKGIDVLYLYFPLEHSHLTSRDVAYTLDLTMQLKGVLPPMRIQDRVALVREYQWADQFPLREAAPPKPRPTKAPPTELETLNRRRAKLAPLIKKWKRARSAAGYNVRKYQQEERSLLRRIAKEKGRESSR